MLVGANTRYQFSSPLALEDALWRAFVGLPQRPSDLGAYDGGMADAIATVERARPANGVQALRDAARNAVQRLGANAPGTVERAASQITFSTRALFLRFFRAAAARSGFAATHAGAFFDGLKLMLPTDLFVLFSPAELRELVEGRRELPWAVLKGWLSFEGELQPWPAELKAEFERSLEDATNEERLRFFCHITGRQGLGEATTLKLYLKNDPDKKITPLAHTCSTTLDVRADLKQFTAPSASTEEKAAYAKRVVDMLWYVIKNSGSEIDAA